MQILQIYNYQMKSVACLFLIAMSLVSLFSCSEDASNRELAEALFLAGDNKPQLDSVLKHYADEPEKLSAARFLISNMPGHYSCADTAAIEQYYRYVDTLVTKYHDMPVDEMTSVMDRLADKLRIDTLGYVQDLKIVTADFLIRNIDDAFACWRETPWAQHLTFEEFCEYILPYKTCELQPLVHWRDMFSNYNQRHLSDFAFCDERSHSVYEAASIFNKYLTLKFAPAFSNVTARYMPLLPQLAIKMPFGNCATFSQAVLPAFRSVGIPIAVDYVPACGHRNGSHVWNSLPTNTGRTLTFVGLTEGAENQQLMNYSMPKVFRRTYSKNREISRMNREEKYVPPFFRNVFQRDVTPEYVKCVDIAFKLKSDDGFVFLTVTSAQDWVPVDYAYLKAGKAEFKNVSPGAVFMVVRYDENGNIQPLTEPFVADRNSKLRFYTADKSVHNITVARKYPVCESSWIFSRQLINGFFEAADTEDFREAVRAGEITDARVEWHDIIVPPETGAHRYWRYNSNEVTSQAPLAELEFYDKATGEKLNGRIISANDGDGSHAPEHAFDSDILTAYFSPVTAAWIGLDFGRPVELCRIRFVPRGDGNCVEPGDDYELLYWANRRWNSAGTKKATGNDITFHDVPEGTLYLLIDRTKGVEHRIFTYENSTQRFH